MNEERATDGGFDRDPDEAGEYPVAPLPATFGEAESPAYRRPSAEVVPDAYDVGPELDDAGFVRGTSNWKEAVAGVRRNVDEFGVEPTVPLQRSTEWYVLQRRLQREAAPQVEKPIGGLDDPARFTLRNFLIVITLASVVLALGRSLPRGVFAGLAGVAAFFSLLTARWLPRGGAVFMLAWWMLLGIYLLTTALAMLGI